MRNNIFITLFCIAGLAILSACTQEIVILADDTNTVEEAASPISFEFDLATKVSGNEFEVGDRVGVYMVSYSDGSQGTMVNSGNTYDNVSLQLTNNGWTPSVNMYWPDKTNKADF